MLGTSRGIAGFSWRYSIERIEKKAVPFLAFGYQFRSIKEDSKDLWGVDIVGVKCFPDAHVQ